MIKWIVVFFLVGSDGRTTGLRYQIPYPAQQACLKAKENAPFVPNTWGTSYVECVKGQMPVYVGSQP